MSRIAPCRRVIATNAKLTGFAGGLEAKAFLLKLESRTASPDDFCELNSFRYWQSSREGMIRSGSFQRAQ